MSPGFAKALRKKLASRKTGKQKIFFNSALKMLSTDPYFPFFLDTQSPFSYNYLNNKRVFIKNK